MKFTANKILIFLALSMLIGCKEKGENKILVTAHRGASGSAPENTLASMAAAIEKKADFCELDVQETADGEIILLHDNTLKRTGGKNLNIWEVDYSQLESIDAGSWFSPDFTGERIPKLSEVIDLVKGKLKLNIELKTNGRQKHLAERTLKIVEKKNFLTDAIFTSFDFEEAEKIKRLNPNAKIGFILDYSNWDDGVLQSGADILSVYYKLINAEFISRAHRAGKEVHVWTVNKPKDMLKMIRSGVDNIITNYPQVLREVLNNSNK